MKTRKDISDKFFREESQGALEAESGKGEKEELYEDDLDHHMLLNPGLFDAETEREIRAVEREFEAHGVHTIHDFNRSLKEKI